jgi:(p)ppGpp synthase/HD superfamily hydrolase
MTKTNTIFTNRSVIKALDFAIKAHDTQTRKNGTTKYIVHPIGVAELVHSYGGDVDQVIAAILHDVVEDTQYTSDNIYSFFGANIAAMVDDLTNTSKIDRPDLNRAGRKAIDNERLSKIPARSQLVKLCDIYYNINDLDGLDAGFIPKFLKEKAAQTYAIVSSWSVIGLPQGYYDIAVAVQSSLRLKSKEYNVYN